jgi:hypothetical protein
MNRMMVLLSVVASVLVGGCAENAVNAPGKPAAQAAAPVTVKSSGKGLELVAVKNACVFFHPSETEFNGGACHRLRTRDLAKGSGEATLIDFDRAALKKFLDKNKEKAVSGKLVLAIRELQQGPSKIEVAALDTASDWGEGNKAQLKAEKGEVCVAAAQFGDKPWTTADGKAVRDLGELLYNAKSDTVKTMLNPKSVTVADADKGNSVNMDLDPKFVEHLADANCRGIVVFTRGNDGKVYFSSRDKEGKEPRLVLSVK